VKFNTSFVGDESFQAIDCTGTDNVVNTKHPKNILVFSKDNLKHDSSLLWERSVAKLHFKLELKE